MFLCLFEGSLRPDFHDPAFKFFVGDDRFVLDLGFISVDGMNRIFQDLGNFFIVVNAHADQGKNSEIGIEKFIVLEDDPVFRRKKGIKFCNKIGK